MNYILSRISRVSITYFLILILALFLLNKYQALAADVEHISLTDGEVRLNTAATILFSASYAKGNQLEMLKLADIVANHPNPMGWVEEHLHKRTANYIGELDNPNFEDIEPGSWFFDRAAGYLTYKLRYPDRYINEGSIGARIQYKAKLIFSDREQIRGLEIKPLAAYRFKGN